MAQAIRHKVAGRTAQGSLHKNIPANIYQKLVMKGDNW